MLLQMKRQGMTILVSTAYLDEGEKCDRLLLMHQARILDDASPKEIRANFPNLEEAMIHRIEEVDEVLANDEF
jgi:ABC-type multidrug transport system ATPase subunit